MAIKPCACKHAYQDKLYGKGMRVKNKTTKINPKTGKPEYRCTVCGWQA